jgi:hypothetical protein
VSRIWYLPSLATSTCEQAQLGDYSSGFRVHGLGLGSGVLRQV